MADSDDSPSTQDRLNEALRLIGAAEQALRAAVGRFDALSKDCSGQAAGVARQHAWRAARMLRADQPFWFSQAGQDMFLDQHVFHGRQGGIFVDVGAYDGRTGSNTLFFELFRGWHGLLIEPSPRFAAQARAVRRAPCLELAVAGSAGESEFLDIAEGFTQMGGLLETYDAGLLAKVRADPRHKETILKVPTRPLGDILSDEAMRKIDFISLDIEGGELAVLQNFPFGAFVIDAWVIENNRATAELSSFMAQKGYRLTSHIGVDEIYVAERLIDKKE